MAPAVLDGGLEATVQACMFEFYVALHEHASPTAGGKPAKRSSCGFLWRRVLLPIVAMVQLASLATMQQLGDASPTWTLLSFLEPLFLPTALRQAMSSNPLTIHGFLLPLLLAHSVASIFVAMAGVRGVMITRGRHALMTFIEVGLVLQTAVLAPIVFLLSVPVSCFTAADHYHRWNITCDSGETLVLAALCIPVALLCTTLVVLNASLRFNNDPNSRDVVAAVSSKPSAQSLFLTAAMASVPTLFPNAVVAWAPIAALGFLLRAASHAVTLPYFHMLRNQMAVAGDIACASLALGATVIAATPSWETNGSDAFDASCIAVGAVFTVVGFALPLVRRMLLQRGFETMRPIITADIALHAGRGDTGDAIAARRRRINERSNFAASVRAAPRGRLPLADSDDEDEVVGAEGGLIGGRPRARPGFAGPGRQRAGSGARLVGSRDSDDDSTDGLPVAQGVFRDCQAFEVELMVRQELDSKGSVQQWRRRRGCLQPSSRVPTSASIERCIWLFTEGIKEFQDDIDSLVEVKLAYMAFMLAFTSNFRIATLVLDGLEQDARPTLFASFRILAARRHLQRSRAAREKIGAATNAASIAEYAAALRDTLALHANAVDARRRLLRTMQRVQPSLTLNDHATASQLGGLIDKCKEATDAAHKSYQRLLRTHPDGQYLHKNYAHFRAELLADQAATSAIGADAAADDGSYVPDKVASRLFVPIVRTGEVKRMTRKFQGGVVLLILLVFAAYMTANSVTARVADDLDFLHTCARMKWAVSATALQYRALALTPTDAAREVTVANAQQWKETSEQLFGSTQGIDGIGARWFEVAHTVTITKPDASTYTEVWNMWDMSNVLVSDALDIVDTSRNASSLYTDVQWRFLTDNTIMRMYPATLNLGQSMEDVVFDYEMEFFIVNGVLTIVSLAFLVVLGVFVFARAIIRMRTINQGVSEVVLALRTLDIGSLLNSVGAARAFCKKAQLEISALLGEEDGDVVAASQPFTYDVDEEQKQYDRQQRGQATRPEGEEPRRLQAVSPPSVSSSAPSSVASPTPPRRASPVPHESGSAPKALGSSAESRGGSASPALAAAAASSGCPVFHVDASSAPASVAAAVHINNTRSDTDPWSIGTHLDRPSRGDVLRASPGVIVVTDTIGTVVFANEAFTKLFGYTAGEVVGNNVTMFQPPEIAAKHAGLMSRVVQGGKPRVVGVAGRQVTGVHKDGSPVPVLLVINRIDTGGKTYFIANMQDTRAHHNDEDDGGADTSGLNEAEQSTTTKLIARVVLALLVIGGLQIALFFYADAGILTATNRGAELNNVGTLHSLMNIIATTSREAVIGDADLWTRSAAINATSDYINRMETIRLGLRYGSDELRLRGSAGRSSTLDALHYGGVDAAGQVTHGADALAKEFLRLATAITQMYADGGTRTAVGTNVTALANEASLQFLLSNAYGELNTLLLESTVAHHTAAKDMLSEASLVDALIALADAVIIALLYATILRQLLVAMMSTARRAEKLLAMLPDELVHGNRDLRQFYDRRTNH